MVVLRSTSLHFPSGLYPLLPPNDIGRDHSRTSVRQSIASWEDRPTGCSGGKWVPTNLGTAILVFEGQIQSQCILQGAGSVSNQLGPVVYCLGSGLSSGHHRHDFLTVDPVISGSS